MVSRRAWSSRSRGQLELEAADLQKARSRAGGDELERVSAPESARARVVLGRDGLASVVLITCVLVALSPGARGQYGWLYGPGQGIPGLNGRASVATTWDPDGSGPRSELLVVGGPFNLAGCVETVGIAAWDGVRWLPLGSLQSGGCRDLLVHDDVLFACGYFTLPGDMEAGVARWDGAAWTAVGAPLGSFGIADALQMYDDGGPALYVGGWFTVGNGAPADNIAKWDGSAWQEVGGGITAGAVLCGVKAMVVHDGKLIAGGCFDYAGGALVKNIAAWDGSFWRPLGSGLHFSPSESVGALTVYDGDLIAGGNFYHSTGPRYVARWDGATWTTVGDGNFSFGNVRGLIVHEDALIAVGGFEYFGGAACSNIARWDGVAWAALGSGVGGYSGNEYASAVAAHQGKLIAAGQFERAGDLYVNNIAAWDGAAWRSMGGISLRYGVIALAEHDGALVVGGDGAILEWDGTAWDAMGGAVAGAVEELTSVDGALLAGGYIGRIGGVRVDNVGLWDGASWTSVGGGVTGGCVYSLAGHDGLLFAGGDFTAAGGITARNVAQWDGNVWSPMGTMYADVNALLVDNGALLAGAGGSSGQIYRWLPQYSAWQWLASPGANGSVHTLAIYDEALIAGGSFSSIGGVPANRVARWDGAAWTPLGSGMDLYVFALAVYENLLIAGGRFDTAGGTPARRIAGWDGASWAPLGSGIGAYSAGTVRALAVHNGELHVGGDFEEAGGRISRFWARWGPAPRGDTNCDGLIDSEDIDPFVLALTNPARYAQKWPYCDVLRADANEDGFVNNEDIDPFVLLLTGD